MTVPGDGARWTFDTLHMGRSSIDLYSNDVGVAFEKIRSFGAYVGGSPTNVAVGAQRLGLRTALLTAVGDDPVADLVLGFLQDNGVEVGCSPRKPGHRTSAALLGIEPPDRFSLVFYRDNCADIELTIDDVLAAPITTSRVFQFAGTNLSREPSRSATLFAAERAREAGACVVFDLDFRPDQWHDPRAFGVAARSAFRLVDIVVGTQDELRAAELRDQDSVEVRHSQVTEARVVGDVDLAMASLLALGPETVVEKRGSRGSRVHFADGTLVEAPGFPVEVENVLGAGDAFAAGLLYGYVTGRNWYESARLGNACGAILVTRHGCANFMPNLEEVMTFVDANGGL